MHYDAILCERLFEIKKILPLFVIFSLAGCEEITPTPPSQAEVKLRASCNDGNNASCTTLLEIEQRERVSAIPLPTFTPYYQDPAAFQRPIRQQTQTICNRGYGGQVVCNQY